MFAVIGLHCGFKSGKCAMYLFVYGNVDFSRSGPDYYDTVAMVVGLKAADVFTQSFYHIPTRSAIFYVVTVEAFGVVVVESGLHRHDGFQFITYGFDVAVAQHFCVQCTLVSVSRINVPSTKYDVVE